MFELLKKDTQTKARLGKLKTHHGEIETPIFMPVGTNGTVKAILFRDLEESAAQIILGNTYHLYLRPGMDLIKQANGLHEFINWKKPILTDSGGYQIFSLAKFRKLTQEGVHFQSHHDGSKHYFTPKDVVDIQKKLGSDIMMPLDECPPFPCSEKDTQIAVDRTTQWAKQSINHFNEKECQNSQFHFGIVQGSSYPHLREQSAKELVDLNFDGYAIGGVSVGEPEIEMFKAIDFSIPFLPENKARYLMGVGYPHQLVKAVAEGIDMFDCVIPTRYGRNGNAFTDYGRLVIRNAEYKDDFRPIDELCSCYACQNFTRSYIRHLINAREMVGFQLLSLHNVHYFLNLMKRIRTAITKNRFKEFHDDFLAKYPGKDEDPKC